MRNTSPRSDLGQGEPAVDSLPFHPGRGVSIIETPASTIRCFPSFFISLIIPLFKFNAAFQDPLKSISGISLDQEVTKIFPLFSKPLWWILLSFSFPPCI